MAKRSLAVRTAAGTTSPLVSDEAECTKSPYAAHLPSELLQAAVHARHRGLHHHTSILGLHSQLQLLHHDQHHGAAHLWRVSSMSGGPPFCMTIMFRGRMFGLLAACRSGCPSSGSSVMAAARAHPPSKGPFSACLATQQTNAGAPARLAILTNSTPTSSLCTQ